MGHAFDGQTLTLLNTMPYMKYKVKHMPFIVCLGNTMVIKLKHVRNCAQRVCPRHKSRAFWKYARSLSKELVPTLKRVHDGQKLVVAFIINFHNFKFPSD